MAAKKAKPFIEKKTGERYATKGAMKRHEKGESMKERVKEYGAKAAAKKAPAKKGK